ncbi:choline transporter-like 2 isoform X2 [Brevipalpus obovatus]|uniref:choline transporter-like 2 isoform X2 n=1 Tax=Brevipalpus obovatus TaxID=246614 RepID=UPI003D9F8CFA
MLTYEPEFRGPIRDRKCTDCLCLLIFVLFISGWAVLSFFAIRYGDPEQVIYPSDSFGRICGRNELRDKPYLYFFNILKCAKWESLNEGCKTTQVCVESCPNYTASFVRYATDKNAFLSLNATTKLEIRQKLVCNYYESAQLKTVSDEQVFEFLRTKKCGLVYFSSEPLAGRCIPRALRRIRRIEILDEVFGTSLQDEDGRPINASMVRRASKGLSKLLNFRSFIENIIQDLCKSWEIIVIGLVLAMVISFTWIILLQIIAGFMVWFSILAILVLSLIGVYGCVNQYLYLNHLTVEEADEDLQDYDLDIDLTTIFRSNLNSYLTNKKTWLILSIICAGLNILLTLTFIFLRQRVSIAISLIKEASKALSHAKLTLLFPLVPYIFQFVSIVFGGFIAIMITASKKRAYRIQGGINYKKIGLPCNPFTYNSSEDGSKCIEYQYFRDDILDYAHLYNIFLTLWILFFIKGMCQMILAGAFASYYWAFDKPQDIPGWPLLTSTYRAFRFHTGSVAFGSLILSMIKLIRIIIEYIDHKCKKYADNAFFKAVTCLCRCCFWCLERFMKFLSTNAYIMIAIHGKSFLASARDSFFLLLRNVLRVAVLDKVADYLLFMGKLVITASMGIVSFYYFSKAFPPHWELIESPDLNYLWVPVVAICLGTYFIASSFFTVYDMAVDTIFLCFLEDCERNDGSAARPYYMSKELMKILQFKNEARNPF